MASRYRALPYDEALVRRVLDRIAAGEMLRDLWRDPDLPTRGDLRRWRHTRPDVSDRIRAAVNLARSHRMSTYDEVRADKICFRLIAGQSMRAICADPAMPSLMTVYLWLKERPDFAHAVAIARDMQADAMIGDPRAVLQALMADADPDALDAQLRRVRGRVGKVRPRKYGL